MKSLEEITSPSFLKQLNINELEDLCQEIRKFIIEHVSETGGHLSSNLGFVEATVALHYVFDSPKDKLLFDVGHQAYTHKILTGRAKDFTKLRQKDGLSGFLKYDESIHDVWEAGHSSTTLSAAAGFLEAKEVDNTIGEVVAIIGDGSIQNGLAFEGLNYIGSQKHQKVIIVLNDNEMSISKNVGRLARMMTKTRIKKGYLRLKRITPRFLKNHGTRIKDFFHTFVYGNNVFRCLGYSYYGPIDGHNIKELIEYFSFAKKSNAPVILHLKTIKGKGYSPAESDDLGVWHGVGPFDITMKQFKHEPRPGMISWAEGISNILSSILSKYKQTRVLNPAMLSGTHLDCLQNDFPERVIDVGINEEHAVVMAAAMARSHLVPIVSFYATFLQRAYDYINHDVARSNNHVIFLIDHAGIVGGDGSTHQGIFDLSLLLPLPHMVVAAPKSLSEARFLLEYAILHEHPFAIRYPKGEIFIEEPSEEDISFGQWKIEKSLSTINILTYGDEVYEFKELLKNENIGLIHAVYIKPLDIELLRKLKNTTLYIVEEVISLASLASMVLDINAKENLNIQIHSFAINDTYVDMGTRNEIKKELGIDAQSILKVIQSK